MNEDVGSILSRATHKQTIHDNDQTTACSQRAHWALQTLHFQCVAKLCHVEKEITLKLKQYMEESKKCSMEDVEITINCHSHKPSNITCWQNTQDREYSWCNSVSMLSKCSLKGRSPTEYTIQIIVASWHWLQVQHILQRLLNSEASNVTMFAM
jgi:hypothetical protein